LYFTGKYERIKKIQIIKIIHWIDFKQQLKRIQRKRWFRLKQLKKEFIFEFFDIQIKDFWYDWETLKFVICFTE
jgi:hypothetical protein